MATFGSSNSNSSLRDRQMVSVLQMLNLNESTNSKSSNSTSAPKEPIWKILIYDRVGMDILTPLFTVQELRQNGITLHIPLHSPDRTVSSSSSIPDVPAIYFALPNDENVDRICRDITSNLYGSFYLNFIRPVPRSKIEDLASAVLNSSDSKCVNRVYDQYVDFVCLEDELFVLNSGTKCGEDFYALNRPSITDSEMNAMIDSIVDSLFSVLVTYGQVPIIRTPKGNAAELIGEKLDKKIRDNRHDPRASLFNQGNASANSDSFSSSYYANSRPLLVILDRNMDLATPLAHSWTYQSLTHDVLENSQNQVKFIEEQAGKPSAQKTYSVDTRRDPFWSSHRGSPFPTVAEAIQNELEDYRKSEEDVKKLKQAMGLENPDLIEFDVSDNTAKLTNAIKDLPQLLEKKRVLDGHTSIATAILSQIKSRSLDTYYDMESKLLTKSETVQINNILLTPNMGTFEDKMRLYLIYYLVNNASVSNSELDQFLQSLSSVAVTEREEALLDAVEFVKKWISYSKMTANPSYTSGSLQRGGASSSKLTDFVSSGSRFVMEGVRNLVLKRQNLPLTKITLDLMESREADDSYRYFDPKQLKQSATKPAQPVAFNECIVFVVGGGNYIEYQNMMDCFRKKEPAGAVGGVSSSSGMGGAGNPSKRIIYGASCLYNGSEFLEQLARLGREMK